MKRINELSIYELAKMKREEFSLVVKNEMMHEGVPVVLPDKPVPPSVPELNPKMSVYKIGGIDFYVDTIEKAEKLRDCMISLGVMKLDSDYVADRGYILYEKEAGGAAVLEDLKIAAFDVYERYEAHKFIADKKGFDNDGRSFADRMKKYEEIRFQQEEFVENLWDIYEEANKKVYEMDNMSRVFYSEYFPVCEDMELSMKFFKKAYHVSKEVEEYIRGKEIS